MKLSFESIFYISQFFAFEHYKTSCINQYLSLLYLPVSFPLKMTSSAFPSLFRLSFFLFILQVMNVGRFSAATRFYQFKVSINNIQTIINISFRFFSPTKQISVVLLIFLIGTNTETHQAMPDKGDCNSQREIPWPCDIRSRRWQNCR